MKLRDRKCPVCGSTDEDRVVVDRIYDESELTPDSFSARKTPDALRFRMVVCRDCDLLYATPVPEQDWYASGYEAAAFTASAEAEDASHSYAELLTEIRSQLPDTRGALDVGTGTGVFLSRLLEADYEDVVGIEPSWAAIDAADPEVQRRIAHGFFEEGSFESESFRLVTCFQTLEHVESPSMLADEAFRVLRSGGAFCLVDHSHRAWSTRILGTRSPVFDIQHLQVFSPSSLRRLLERAGFENIQICAFANRYHLDYWIRLLPISAQLKDRLLRTLRRVGLDRISLRLRAGNIAAIGFKP